MCAARILEFISLASCVCNQVKWKCLAREWILSCVSLCVYKADADVLVSMCKINWSYIYGNWWSATLVSCHWCFAGDPVNTFSQPLSPLIVHLLSRMDDHKVITMKALWSLPCIPATIILGQCLSHNEGSPETEMEILQRPPGHPSLRPQCSQVPVLEVTS